MTTESNWEKIEVGRAKPTPLVTFSINRAIRFNKALIEKYDLGTATHVKPFFNMGKEMSRIGFEFQEEPAENSLKLSWTEEGSAFVSGFSILGRVGLTKEHLMSKKTKRRFRPYIEEIEGMGIKLVIIDVPKIKEEKAGDGEEED